MGALEALLGWAFGSAEGFASVIMLLSVGRWIRKGAVVGELLSIGGVFLILLALLALTGAVEIHVDVIGSLVSSGLDLATSATGVLPW